MQTRVAPAGTHAPPGVPRIAAHGITKAFGTGAAPLLVLDNVSLAAAGGEFVTIIGPSGCGKSTLFALLAGLQRPTRGQVLIDGWESTGRLGLVGYMPQRDLLMPWKTVLDNAAIGLELQGVKRRQARQRAAALFGRFGLTGFEHHFPATLSGGMRQRAALLRTVLTGHETLLLDEPFGALDALTRMDMQEWLLEVWREFARTVVLVTHDVDEALYLSDRVYVLSARPARVQRVMDVPLPRPRGRDRVVVSPEFALLKQELLASLRRGHPEGDG